MAAKNPTTDEAFADLVNRDDLWGATGLPLYTKRYYRYTLLNGKGVTIDKKEELLKKAGYTIQQQTTWHLPG